MKLETRPALARRQLRKLAPFAALLLSAGVGCVSPGTSDQHGPSNPQANAATGNSSAAMTKRSVASTPSLDGIEVTVRGGDENSFFPVPSGQTIADKEAFDVVVVGAGLSGLSSAIYLTDAGQRVLVLEKEAQVGGLAAWSDGGSQVLFDRGAAYWTDTYEEEQAILSHIGLKNFKTKNPIPEPIDSYFVRGQMFQGIWDKETIEKLPASFALFELQLRRTDADGMIPNQPFEEFEKYGGKMDLDRLTATQWIESMPELLRASLPRLAEAAANAPSSNEMDVKKNPKYAYSEALRVLARFDAELRAGRLEGTTGMRGVTELMDLYCRSALGNLGSAVSAMAFANFYISEVETRYTSTQGTGLAADNMAKILRKRPKLATIKTSAPVSKIVSVGTREKGHEEIHYVSGGATHVVKAKYVVFASQVKLAPTVLEGFAADSPEQAKLMSGLGYSHYSVHAVYLEGHPYRASYDTWIRAADYTDDDPTDMILGRWMDPKMLGYEGFRDFSKDPPDSEGVLTIYHPLTQAWMKNGAYSSEKAIAGAKKAVLRVEDLFSALPSSLFRGPLKIKKIETNRWPLSVHVAAPGHYIEKARLLRKPYKRVFFANNNLGTPAFEEALFRGHCAADNILKRENPAFTLEKWSRCPLD